MKIYLPLLFALLISGGVLAQVTGFDSDLGQNEKAIAFIRISDDDQFNRLLVDNELIYEDYITVELLSSVVPHLDISLLKDKNAETYSEKDINLILNRNRVAQQILSYWFNWQSNRTFDIEYVREKGILDAGDIENILDRPSKKISFQKSSGLKILNETYLLLIDYRDLNLATRSNVKVNSTTGSQNINKYSVTVNYYLVKLDFNNSIAERFFFDYWISEDTADNAKKKADFASADFPFRLVYVKSFEAAGMQQIPEREQLNALVSLAQERAVSIIESEGLYDKNSIIQNDKPLTAAIGYRQKVRFDSRYTVYEKQIDDGGGIEQKRIGIVKVMKVGDNRIDKNASLSEFYQIAGKKISTSGMYLEKKQGVGLNIGIDRTVIGPINTSGRIEYYFSKLLDGTIPPEKKARAMTSVKLYIEGGYNNGTYAIEGRNRKFEFVRGSIGISKDFYPARFFHWSPFVGYGIESATWKSSDNTISTNYIDAGIRLGVNIIHNLQLIATIKNNMIVDSVMLDAERDVIDDNFNYAQTFSNRKGVSLGLGLRIML